MHKINAELLEYWSDFLVYFNKKYRIRFVWFIYMFGFVPLVAYFTSGVLSEFVIWMLIYPVLAAFYTVRSQRNSYRVPYKGFDPKYLKDGGLSKNEIWRKITFVILMTFVFVILMQPVDLYMKQFAYTGGNDAYLAALRAIPIPILMLLALIVAPLGEELLFRGFLVGHAKSESSIWTYFTWSVFVSVAFGVVHGTAYHAVAGSLMGLFFTLMFVRYNNVIYSIVAHIFYNMFVMFGVGALFGNLLHVKLMSQSVLIGYIAVLAVSLLVLYFLCLKRFVFREKSLN